MTFSAKKRYTKAVVDCSNDEIIVEQSHKEEVDINNIIKRHGMDLIQKTAALRAPDMQFDDVTGNDFQEAMNIILKAEGTFMDLPSKVRKQFNNSPAEFLDFVQNPDNEQALIDMGLAHAPEPVPAPAPAPEPEPAPA